MAFIALIKRQILLALAGVVVMYCLYMLSIIATIPDLRLRFLLIDRSPSLLDWHEIGSTGGDRRGIIVRQTDGVASVGEKIQPGDRLFQVGSVRIDNFLDYSRLLLSLRNAEIAPGGNPPEGTDLLHPGLPSLVQEKGGPRWIRIHWQQEQTGRMFESALALQPAPVGEAGLTFCWFLLQLAISGVGLLAFWSRPFDRAAQLFFAMCLVTMGAFVGGLHWWIMVGSYWLSLPFLISGVLMPVVVLHFFLVFPRPKPIFLRYPQQLLAAIYAPSVGSLLFFLVTQTAMWRWIWQPESIARTDAVLSWLLIIRQGIYFYLAVAACYFLVTLASLIHARLTTRNPVEWNQVNSILWAAFIATGFIGYTLLLAYFHRTAFALGGGRIPMFLASLVFMLAYALGIVRFKLMLIDQIISRGMWYYTLSYGSTALVAAALAGGAMALSYQSHLLPSNLQAVLVAGVLMTGVVLVLWLRDGWQRAIDRRFFREKYRLDKALRRMNRASDQLTDPQSLAERMLNSCRDVLQTDRAALYLRSDKGPAWRLLCAQGDTKKLPLHIPVTDEFLQALSGEGTIQRSLGGADARAADQTLVRELHAELMHGLEVDGEISAFVALGVKHGGASYSAEDLTFLTALGQMTGVALHNAKVQQDLGHLNEELRLRVERIAQQKQQIVMLQTELAAVRTDEPAEPAGEFQRTIIAGNSPALNSVLEMVRKVAASETTVLLRGESGTGKELVAHVIHENCARRNGPMITVHCAALAPGLLESELFGHVKGAFTGAQSDRQGRFELAQGGTIFLDEIGDISPETQVKLLRVLQQQEFERVGGSETIRVDVRIIAATHQNLEQLIVERKFREDLYYRLNVISVTLPPLRERMDDLIELSMRFLKRAATRSGKSVIALDDDAVGALMHYNWPGNIRELENVIERAVVLADGSSVTVADLPADLQAAGRTPARGKPQSRFAARPAEDLDRVSVAFNPETNWRRMDEHQEREMLLSALEQCQGNKARAARLLGLPRSTFFSKLKKFAIAE